MSEPFVGEIRMCGFNFAPKGWAMCNGQLIPISQNTALFSLLGTFYGGDGRSTFAAVGGAEQAEQGRVLGDGQDLTVADGPPLRGEVEAEHADLADEGVHGLAPSSAAGIRR